MYVAREQLAGRRYITTADTVDIFRLSSAVPVYDHPEQTLEGIDVDFKKELMGTVLQAVAAHADQDVLVSHAASAHANSNTMFSPSSSSMRKGVEPSLSKSVRIAESLDEKENNTPVLVQPTDLDSAARDETRALPKASSISEDTVAQAPEDIDVVKLIMSMKYQACMHLVDAQKAMVEQIFEQTIQRQKNAKMLEEEDHLISGITLNVLDELDQQTQLRSNLVPSVISGPKARSKKPKATSARTTNRKTSTTHSAHSAAARPQSAISQTDSTDSKHLSVNPDVDDAHGRLSKPKIDLHIDAPPLLPPDHPLLSLSDSKRAKKMKHLHEVVENVFKLQAHINEQRPATVEDIEETFMNAKTSTERAFALMQVVGEVPYDGDIPVDRLLETIETLRAKSTTDETYTDRSMTLCGLGAVLRFHGQLFAAMSALNEALQANGSNFEALWQRHLVYLAFGDYDKAVRDLSLVTSTKRWHHAYRSKADILMMQRHWDDAVYNYTSAIIIDGNDVDAYYHRAECRWEMGEYVLAVQVLIDDETMNIIQRDWLK